MAKVFNWTLVHGVFAESRKETLCVCVCRIGSLAPGGDVHSTCSRGFACVYSVANKQLN